MDMVPGEAGDRSPRERLDDVIVVRSLTKLLCDPRVARRLRDRPVGAGRRLRAVRPPWSANALALAALAAAAEPPGRARRDRRARRGRARATSRSGWLAIAGVRSVAVGGQLLPDRGGRRPAGVAALRGQADRGTTSGFVPRARARAPADNRARAARERALVAALAEARGASSGCAMSAGRSSSSGSAPTAGRGSRKGARGDARGGGGNRLGAPARAATADAAPRCERGPRRSTRSSTSSRRAEAGRTTSCVLASGDPMLHGIGATLARRIGPSRLAVISHPSAFALACARLGWPAAEVELVSAVGRPPEVVARLLQPGRRRIVATRRAPAARPRSPTFCASRARRQPVRRARAARRTR